jgi:hypothetical protein
VIGAKRLSFTFPVASRYVSVMSLVAFSKAIVWFLAQAFPRPVTVIEWLV